MRFTPIRIGRGWQILDHGNFSTITQGFFLRTEAEAIKECEKLEKKYAT